MFPFDDVIMQRKWNIQEYMLYIDITIAKQKKPQRRVYIFRELL